MRKVASDAKSRGEALLEMFSRRRLSLVYLVPSGFFITMARPAIGPFIRMASFMGSPSTMDQAVRSRRRAGAAAGSWNGSFGSTGVRMDELDN
jgi:hypothetical protein